MPSDDYALSRSGGGGALKLKGGGVDKKKKKKSKRVKTDLERNLSVGEDASSTSKELVRSRSKDRDASEGDEEEHRSAEGDDGAPAQKTESERQYEDAKKKRLLKMAGKSGSRPELLKTHKERVEELNTYLSKLSEHHDMPKIGPG
ncbi:hypothetical protein V2A60_007376 [Cordyceps javanica]|uniref:DUF1754-domain-containing protein n=1 Tax=Cordyceps javanica TaxID=43265 RepID=A0A545W810_9HYPO|nr:hypothetical protein IF1G_03007 [Cordyceps javanica]TQW10134.1 hypothetical protein IF2G_02924 [Cordyceps javanica]